MSDQHHQPGVAANDFVAVAVADRSGFDESIHFGAAVVIAPDGAITASWGNPDMMMFPRSANKPMLTDAMMGIGLQLSTEHAAIAASSHDGTPTHTATVAALLHTHGLTAADLGNTHTLPYNRDAADALIATGGGKSAITQNCSGKHAAMLAACKQGGWQTSEYLDQDHPLQVALTDHLSDLGGGVGHIGIDGCGAPTHAMTLAGLARSFRTLTERGAPVATAMATHPELVGGDRRDNTRIMRALPGAIAKDGAEGVMAIALADGWSVAVKIADGAGRAAGIVAIEALRHAGAADGVSVGDPILGHDRPVGTVRTLLDA